MSSRWFHSNCSAEQAESLLLTDGVDGSFLVRPSSKIGNFTISVRYEGGVNHIKIINDGDSFCLAGSPDPFATLQALIHNYMENPKSIKDKKGGFIELLYPVRSHDPTSERWFHGRLGSKDAERLLLSRGRNGSYLVRESQSQPGQYVLAVKCKSSVHQIIIRQVNGIFEIAGAPLKKMTSLRELVDYLEKNKCLKDIKDQSSIELKKPFHTTSFLASDIAERIEVLNKTTDAGKCGFQEEFQQLTNFDQNEGAYTMNVGGQDVNRPKNRYKNILPYDHSRVTLKVDKKEDSDYINANFINPELESNLVYIASQGPLESTNADFWSMIYHQGSSIVLMLTNEVENNKVKCAKYWPNFGETLKFAKFHIENMLETSTENYIRRELQVTSIEKGKKTAPRIIYQFHYIAWPDHDVPDDPSDILGLLSEVHSKQTRDKTNSPIIVHCSAGIGRTGTVIAIDILIQLFDELGFDQEVDIEKTCQILRTQRSGMIQTEHQYRLIYQALANYIDGESKRHAVKMDKGTKSQPRQSYGNIDFGKRPGSAAGSTRV